MDTTSLDAVRTHHGVSVNVACLCFALAQANNFTRFGIQYGSQNFLKAIVDHLEDGSVPITMGNVRRAIELIRRCANADVGRKIEITGDEEGAKDEGVNRGILDRDATVQTASGSWAQAKPSLIRADITRILVDDAILRVGLAARDVYRLILN